MNKKNSLKIKLNYAYLANAKLINTNKICSSNSGEFHESVYYIYLYLFTYLYILLNKNNKEPSFSQAIL